MKARDRLDRLLVERGLCENRTRAQALILGGKVVVDEHAVTKPGTLVALTASVRLKGEAAPYVSRGGLKLRGALDRFPGLQVAGRVAMDVGASTGGFTDCLLQAGVVRVYAVDVGYGQLAWTLARDPRVVVLDRQNIRELEPARIPEPISLFVADCSFISLTLVLSSLPRFADGTADVLALVKPQFEVGRALVGKGGIVRDPAAHQHAVERVLSHAAAVGFRGRGQCESPLEGKHGNREFFVWLEWAGRSAGP